MATLSPDDRSWNCLLKLRGYVHACYRALFNVQFLVFHAKYTTQLGILATFKSMVLTFPVWGFWQLFLIQIWIVRIVIYKYTKKKLLNIQPLVFRTLLVNDYHPTRGIQNIQRRIFNKAILWYVKCGNMKSLTKSSFSSIYLSSTTALLAREMYTKSLLTNVGQFLCWPSAHNSSFITTKQIHVKFFMHVECLSHKYFKLQKCRNLRLAPSYHTENLIKYSISSLPVSNSWIVLANVIKLSTMQVGHLVAGPFCSKLCPICWGGHFDQFLF